MRVLVATFLVLACATARADTIPAGSFTDLHWRMVGPFRGGRTKACAGIPNRPNVFLVGAVNGGVWRTDDAGRTWQPIFDGQPTQSIGSIAIAPSNPNIIYVGSGEGLRRPDVSVGDGIYRSTDGGKTWAHLGLRDGQAIPKLAVDPGNPNKLFAAVLGHPFGPNDERGIYRSLDGGATWTRVLQPDRNTGGYDVEIDPQHPNLVYATLWESRLGPWEDGNDYEGSHGGIFKSSDGGTTWTKLTKGLPPDVRQADLAIAASRPNRIYAGLSTSEKTEYGTGKGMGIYRTDDGGASWIKITDDPRPQMKIGGGDMMGLAVDPKNPERVYSAAIVAMTSGDGGKTWTWLRGAPGGDDYQNLWINPTDPQSFVLVADQGAVVTVNGGRTWSSWYNQPTSQLYHVGITADVPYRVCSGQQESGSVCIASRGSDGTVTQRDWRPVGVIEYGYVAPDPRNPDIVYGAGRTAVTRFSYSTGTVADITPVPVRDKDIRAERTQPIVFSPVVPGLMYYAANALYATTNAGQSWKKISPDLAHPRPGIPASIASASSADNKADTYRGAIYAVAPSFKTANTIWAGTDDGKLWITRDGGGKWTDITPAAITGWSKVTQVEASHFDDVTAYASVSRFRLDDPAPYIYKTHDGGKTWTPIVTGLPAGPVNAVREDPVAKGLLYAATELGVSVSFDDGASWQSLQLNLPRSSARDLAIAPTTSDLIVATHGRGFWILDGIARLRELKPGLVDTLFTPAKAIRFAKNQYPDTPVPPDEPMAENPPTGAIIDYYLAKQAKEVALEIIDTDGTVLRRYTSDDPPELDDEELRDQLIPAYWTQPRTKLGTSAGAHRWVWDMRRTRPLAGHYSYPINAAPHDTVRVPDGARMPAGTYTVRLVIDGKAQTKPVRIETDPRSKLSRAQLDGLAKLERKLADEVTRGSEVVLQARSALEQLSERKTSDGALANELTKLTAEIKDALEGDEKAGTPGAAGITETLIDLYKAIGIDAVPTATVVQAEAATAKRLDTIAAAWDKLVKGRLAELNKRLVAAKLAPIKPEQRPKQKESEGNEE